MKGDLDTFSNGLFDFCKVHAAGRIELLTISLPRGSSLNLEDCFNALIIRIVGRNKKSSIPYVGVLVGVPPEHAHILWIKPYVRYNRLNWMWHEITNGTATGITSRTVRGDKSKRNDVRRLVKYLVEQEDHHGLPVTFVHSHKWLVHSKEKSQPDEQAIFKGLDDVQTS
ncbi:hypothetical protein [Methanoregula sp.]|uniref:hypothetical protein n=1 Tax=Methanoregula sp. TaxID=2052170 RepID=UPI003BAF655B